MTEVDPVRALDAIMQGFRVLPMAAAAPLGEVFITATGSRDVISAEHMAVMRDGAILSNAGHFDVEVDVRALAGMAVEVTRDVRPHTDEYLLADGRRLLLLAEGRIVNLVAAEGNPPTVMDVSFAGQALVLAGWPGSTARCCPGCTACRRPSMTRSRRWRWRRPAPRSTRSPRPSGSTWTPGSRTSPDGLACGHGYPSVSRGVRD